jgi:glutathione S-transferase
MHVLTHYRLCPHSRSIRLALAELEVAAELVEERPWEYRPQFLQMNPAGELPVLQMADGGPQLCGAYAISEYLAEWPGRPRGDGRIIELFPGDAEERGEVRRLADWFHGKLNREVTRELVAEKLWTHQIPGRERGPDPDVLRAVRANLRYHLSYVSFLSHQRRWLAGDEPSFADLAAAAHLSVLDYLGELPWEDYQPAKAWYARVKSRRSFRALLADRIPGTPPPLHYTDLDF